MRPGDRAHDFDIATGSALECAAAVDLAGRLAVGPAPLRTRIRAECAAIVPMLIRLSRSVRAR